MSTPPDPFAQSFDSIEIERAPSPAAIENAIAALAPTAAAPENGQPGFFLLDDADGRFVVDREMGVVMLADEALLAAEHGAVHPARLRVVEPSGASYELDLKLRLTGRVPHVLGAEDFGLGDATHEAPRPSTTVAPWTTFAAARGVEGKLALEARGAYGALLAVHMPATRERVSITFAGPATAPAPEQASWSL